MYFTEDICILTWHIDPVVQEKEQFYLSKNTFSCNLVTFKSTLFNVTWALSGVSRAVQHFIFICSLVSEAFNLRKGYHRLIICKLLIWAVNWLTLNLKVKHPTKSTLNYISLYLETGVISGAKACIFIHTWLSGQVKLVNWLNDNLHQLKCKNGSELWDLIS